MKVGDQFSSYKEFEKALALYKLSVYNEYWIRDARTLNNQRKRFPDTVNQCNQSLKYYYIRLACVKGGRPFQSKNDKSTRKCSTLKQDCQASIFLRISKCQKYLTITEIKDEHNHSSSKTYFTSLPRQRFKRRTREYAGKVLEGCEKQKTGFSDNNHPTNSPKCLTNRRKFRIIDEKCKTMAKLCSEVSTPVFLKRVDLIQNIIQLWTEGKDLILNENIDLLTANNNIHQCIETPDETTTPDQFVEIPVECTVTVGVQLNQSTLKDTSSLRKENYQPITQKKRNEPRTESLKNIEEEFITQHKADKIKEEQNSREEDYIKEEYLEDEIFEENCLY